MSLLDDKTMKVLTKALDAASVRHKAISNNIANVNTRDYKAEKVEFETALNRVLNKDMGGVKDVTLDKTHFKHFGGASSIDGVQAKIYKDTTSSMRVDGNNVDIDVEMSNLAANQLAYETVIRRINGKISSIKSVISGGR